MMSAKEHIQEQLQRTGSAYRGDECLCSWGGGQSLWGKVCVVRAGMLEDASSGGAGAEVDEPYKVKEGVLSDNCQSNKFLLGLMVGKLILWYQAGRECLLFSCEISGD